VRYITDTAQYCDCEMTSVGPIIGRILLPFSDMHGMQKSTLHVVKS